MFRLFHRLVTLIALALLLAVVPLHAATVRIIGLPITGDGKAIQQQIIAQALKTGPGDSLLVLDAPDRKLVAEIAIPDDPKYARVERRLPFLIAPMRDLKTYTDAMPAAKPDQPNLVHGVAFLDEVGTLIARYPNQDVRVLILGSAWFTAPGATTRNEYRGTYPSDGMILDDRSGSLFGTSNLRDLTGAAVSYCFTERTADFVGPAHRERIERAWSLEIDQRGGSLTSFSGDPKACWDAFAADSPPPAHKFTIDPEDARQHVMYRPEDSAPRIVKATTVKTLKGGSAPAATSKQREAARFRQRVSTIPPNRRDGTAWLGISWTDPGADLDLYARCSPTMPLLFFGNPRTVEGRHNFDYRNATGDGFETIDFLSSCPDITKADVFVNFYEGSLRHGPKGTFAIEFDGKFYKTEFMIAAKSGNQAGGLRLGQLNPPHWVRINLASVLRLPPSQEGRSVRTIDGPLK